MLLVMSMKSQLVVNKILPLYSYIVVAVVVIVQVIIVVIIVVVVVLLD